MYKGLLSGVSVVKSVVNKRENLWLFQRGPQKPKGAAYYRIQDDRKVRDADAWRELGDKLFQVQFMHTCHTLAPKATESVELLKLESVV